MTSAVGIKDPTNYRVFTYQCLKTRLHPRRHPLNINSFTQQRNINPPVMDVHDLGELFSSYDPLALTQLLNEDEPQGIGLQLMPNKTYRARHTLDHE